MDNADLYSPIHSLTGGQPQRCQRWRHHCTPQCNLCQPLWDCQLPHPIRCGCQLSWQWWMVNWLLGLFLCYIPCWVNDTWLFHWVWISRNVCRTVRWCLNINFLSSMSSSKELKVPELVVLAYWFGLYHCAAWFQEHNSILCGCIIWMFHNKRRIIKNLQK